MGEMQLSLGPDLQMELIRVSRAMNADVSALLNQAVRDHLDQLAEQKIIAESKAFRSMHAELLQRYKGEYVAVHNGEVVDHDVNLGALNRRIRAQYGCLVQTAVNSCRVFHTHTGLKSRCEGTFRPICGPSAASSGRRGRRKAERIYASLH